VTRHKVNRIPVFQQSQNARAEAADGCADGRNEEGQAESLVRFASVALSASMAPHDDAYIASESPDRTAVPTSSGRFVPTRAKRTRVKLAMIPPRTTNRFLP